MVEVDDKWDEDGDLMIYINTSNGQCYLNREEVKGLIEKLNKACLS